MISICIPVYNVSVEHLVAELTRQIVSSGCVAEICVVDDGSEDEFKLVNRCLIVNQLVRYSELPRNIGRSAIRNYLADVTAYPFLLFLDCDVEINTSFLSVYLKYISEGQVVAGGVSYHSQKPADNLLLHWKNGTHREVHSVTERSKNPFQAFLSCNFLISRDLFQQIRFNEQIKEYGYEDALLGIELSKRKIHVVHIDNPVVHLGLEDTDVFLNKIEKSIGTLLLLRSIVHESDLCRYIKLYHHYKRLPEVLKMVVSIGFSISRKAMVWQLHRKNPSLFVFDCYKLGYLCSLKYRKI